MNTLKPKDITVTDNIKKSKRDRGICSAELQESSANNPSENQLGLIPNMHLCKSSQVSTTVVASGVKHLHLSQRETVEVSVQSYATLYSPLQPPP